MSLLYYWRDYLDNTENGPTFKLNQNSELLASAAVGETLWAIARTAPDTYALVAEMVVSEAGRNAPDDPEREEYGEFYVKLDRERSRYFVAESQSAGETIKSLSFAPKAEFLGQSFQGGNAVRRLTPSDDEVLNSYARSLTLDARLSADYQGDQDHSSAPTREAVEAAIKHLTPRRRERVLEEFVRDSKLVQQIKAQYGNRCQICDSVPFNGLLGDVAEAHHIQWLSRGGADAMENIVLLCPNHHSAVHAADPQFDWATLTFRFAARNVPIRLNQHLKPK